MKLKARFLELIESEAVMNLEITNLSNFVYIFYKDVTGNAIVSKSRINLLTYIVFQEYLKANKALVCDCTWHLSLEGLPFNKKIVNVNRKFPKPYFLIRDKGSSSFSWLGYGNTSSIQFTFKNQVFVENLIAKYINYSLTSLANIILMKTALSFSELNPGDEISNDLIYNSKSFA